MAQPLALPPGATLVDPGNSSSSLALPPGATLVDAGTPRATAAQAKQHGDDAEQHLAAEPDSYQGGMLDSLGREIESGAKSVYGMVPHPEDIAHPLGDWNAGGVAHQFMDEPTMDEKQMFKDNPTSLKQPSLGANRLTTEPIATAVKWYKDAATGKVPDPVGQAESVGPEAFGQAGAQTALGGTIKAGAEMFKGTPLRSAVFGMKPPIEPTPAQHVAAAMGDPHSALPAETVTPTLRRVAGNMGVQPQDFQGLAGLKRFGEVLQSTIDENQSARQSMIAPIAQERVPLTPGSPLHEYFKGQNPTVEQLNSELNNIHALQRSYKYFNGPPSGMTALRGGAAEAAELGQSANKALYDYTRMRTGADISGLQREASSILQLRDNFEAKGSSGSLGTRARITAGEANFRSPQPQGFVNTVGKYVGAALGKNKINTALSMFPSTSPVEAFNSRMANAFSDLQGGSNPYMQSFHQPPTVPSGPAPGLPPASSIQQPASPLSPQPQLTSGLPSGQAQIPARATGGMPMPASPVPPQGALPPGRPGVGPYTNPGPIEGEIMPPDSPVPPAIRGALPQHPTEAGASPLDALFKQKAPELQSGPRSRPANTLGPATPHQLPASHINPVTGQKIAFNGSEWIDTDTGQPIQTRIQDPALADIESKVRGRALEMEHKYPVKKGSLKQ